MKLFTLVLLILAAPIVVFAQSALTLDRTATSTIKTSVDKDGKPILTTTNRRFTYLDQRLSGAGLLLEEFRRINSAVRESADGFVKVEAWLQPDFTKKAWTIEQEGDEGHVSDEFYVVTKYGCCMSLATTFYFDIKTGQRVFSATRPLSSVIVPNTGLYRYVAFHSHDAIIPALEPRRDDFRGLLQYGSYQAPLWKLAIYSTMEPIVRIKFQYENKVVDSKDALMLWGVDGKADKSSLSNFAIVLSMDSAGDIVLPVNNDTLDLTRATIPPRFHVELIK
jgi:hypothetical protein